MLASGSTDRTLRIWDLETAKNTHTFIGHTSTIRCIAVARPTWIDGADGPNRKEKWPKQAMIVTGSRDNTLRVWRFPRPGDPEYHGTTAAEDLNPTDEEIELNPYHLKALQGHEHAVRSVAVHGRTIVSGSYDTTVRVWDLITGEENVVIDTLRQQTCSGSMDGTVRIWSLIDGSARHILTGHTSLVGLLSVSSNSLVSAAADAMVKIWNLSDGKLQHTLTGHLGAVTCVQNDDEKVITGADESLKVWNMKDGTFDRDLLKKPTVTGVWQIAFDGRFCVAATNQYDDTMVEVWDFANSRAPNDAVGKDGEDEEDEDVGADDDGAESDDEAGEVSGSHAQ
ncbi:SCF ubiquitin ligase complex subunit cdc4 [Tulasnella sp. 330]|nr:SCF ubiquitin ligase complex subunit cdc4 [Tulasnella sp. 330]